MKCIKPEIKFPKGSKVKVCGDLYTTIESVTWENKRGGEWWYWFRDKEGRLWSGCEEDIKLIEI
jgi:hypothetical protein